MERRLEDLEVKLAFVERHLEELDQLVRGTLDAMDALRREVKTIRDQKDVVSARGPLEEEVPPHHDRL